MRRYETPTLLPPFSFTEAERLSPSERIDRALEEMALWLTASPYAELFDKIPPLAPIGAEETEITEQERLNEAPFPHEYRLFLRKCRYADLGGVSIWGFDGQGEWLTDSPWVSDERLPGASCWVVGDYDKNGDQFLILAGEEAVYIYLHENGPTIERFADSFSLALWRLAYER